MTRIEWTDQTWNPTTGCTRVSAGCDHCYAVAMTRRLAGMGKEKYQGLVGKGHFNGVVKCHKDALSIPLRWRKPRMVFVNSMSDLFHRDVPFEFIDRVFAVMALCPQHTFQVLTKRPERMAEYLSKPLILETRSDVVAETAVTLSRKFDMYSDAKPRGVVFDGRGSNPAKYIRSSAKDVENRRPWYWPLPNVWLGTSVEDQEQLNKRLHHIMECPAAVTFLSIEPLLGGVHIPEVFLNPLRPPYGKMDRPWVIVGCESKGARVGRFADEYPEAALSIIDRCRSAGVPVFHKQMPIKGRVSHDMSKWPEDLRVRQWPAVATAEVV